jgi:hypothetical protein
VSPLRAASEHLEGSGSRPSSSAWRLAGNSNRRSLTALPHAALVL